MKRWMFFVYGVTCHLLFFAVYGYMALFTAGIVLPHTVDTVKGASLTAVTVDLALLGLFAAQHSIMARPAFKSLWTRIVPQAIERSTYVLFACIVTFVMMWQWRGIDTVVWDLHQPALRAAMWGLFGVGWIGIPLVSFMINHFDLFGTRQVWLHLQGRAYEPLSFRVQYAYRHVRHPIYVGWAVAIWATPTMTGGHFLFAAGTTVYMALATLLEERDLVAHFGHVYEHYRRSVPMFLPRLRSGESADRLPAGDAAARHS